MGAMKEEPRYWVLSARVSAREMSAVQVFAEERKINQSEAARMLINIGLRALAGRLP